MTGDPPSIAAVNARVTAPSLDVATTSVGASGTASGVSETTTDSTPGPAGFTARSLTLYVVPFVRPGTTTTVVFDGGFTGTHEPLSTLY